MNFGSKALDFADFERKIFEVPYRSKSLLFLPALISLYEISPIVKAMLEDKDFLAGKKYKGNGYSDAQLSKAYAELKQFSEGYNLMVSRLPAWGENYPIESSSYQISTLDIFLTHACNMGCSYCCVKGGDFGLKFRPKMMNWETAKKTLDWFFANNKDGRLPMTISFFGGEPLLNLKVIKQSLEYIRRLVRKGNYPPIKQVISTNGTLLNEEVFELLNKYSCDLCVSVDATKGTHDKKRCFKNGGKTYDLVIDKILYALNKYPRLNIETNSTLGVEDNIKDFLFKPFISKRLLRRFNIEHSIFSSSMENDGAARKFIADFHLEFKRKYRSILKNGWRPPYTFNDPYILARLNSLSINRIYRRVNCGAGLTKAAVVTNGDIYVCALSLKEGHKWKIGNVFHGINPRKNLSLLKEYQRILSARKGCATCWARYLCIGICPMSKMNSAAYFTGTAGFCDRFRLYTEYSLRFYALLKSVDALKKNKSRVINDAQIRGFASDELFRYTFILRRLLNHKHSHIKQITPFPAGS